MLQHYVCYRGREPHAGLISDEDPEDAQANYGTNNLAAITEDED